MRAMLPHSSGQAPISSIVFAGAALTAGLLLVPAPASARPADLSDIRTLAGETRPFVPVLSGTLDARAEQRRGGGGGGGGRTSGGGGGGGQAVPRGGSGGGVSSGGTRSGGGSGGATTRGDAGGGSRGGDVRAGDGGRSGARVGDTGGIPPNSRPRGDRPATGTAVERRGGGGRGPDTVIIGGGYYGGFYPWGWGGLGLGGYYGWYDPWGWYDPYGPAVGGYAYYADGALKLKIKPRQAEVYVDGYFAGAVDDYDGVFQRLHLEPGPHRIEVRLDGYDTLSFEVRILPDRTVTYKGELQKRATAN